MKQSAEYWDKKIGLFLHDPLDKMISIPGHETRAAIQTEAFGAGAASKEEYRPADMLASGMDRAALPGYSKDNPKKDGSVDFAKMPEITHPVSAGPSLKLQGFTSEKANAITDQLVKLIKSDTDDLMERWGKDSQFNYLFFMLRKRLATKNVGDLGLFWDLLPADSRIPDHSIWNHCAMTSALGSCFDLSDQNQASLVVYSLSPIQPFISKTRKLRDHWVASVILSWLTFEGICSVIEELGGDHILYPSLNDQFLVEEYLSGKLDAGDRFADYIKQYDEKRGVKKDSSIASFPNKFVFLAPSGMEETFVQAIESRITEKWRLLADTVMKFVKNASTSEEFKKVFQRQTNGYWKHSWNSVNLVDIDNRSLVEKHLFDPQKFEAVFETLRKFADQYTGKAVVYPVSHSIAQTTLAISKSQPMNARAPEPGIKCPQCGEFEILHDCDSSKSGKGYAGEYKKNSDEFWQRISKKMGKAQVRDGEKLCAICAIKRLAPVSIEKFEQTHILQTVFKDAESFPSTTELALTEYFHEAGVEQKDRGKIADSLHDNGSEEEHSTRRSIESKNKVKLNETDNYYGILIMDGDKMGDLVNGVTISAKWQDVIHPDVLKRFSDGTLGVGIWKELLENKRILSPQVHSSISEALGTFSAYAVPLIIEKFKGRLLYAGGDDVAAVLPLSTALEAAIEIQRAYNTRFATIKDNAVETLNEACPDTPVFKFPGIGSQISISAGLLIVHHKQPLRGAIEEAHRLLETTAKDEMGRNALALRLKKRSGQPRDFKCKWNEMNPFSGTTLLDSFEAIKKASMDTELSTSLIYGLESVDEMLSAVVESAEKEDRLSDVQKERIIAIIAYEVGHSGFGQDRSLSKIEKKKRADELAGHLAGLVLRYWGKKWHFEPESPIVARYIAKGGKR